MKIVDLNINFDALPDEAQRELVDFYEFLVFKYQHKQMILPEKEHSVNSSKWAKIAQRVQNDPVHLAGYAEQLKNDIQEFRNHFEFKHHDIHALNPELRLGNWFQ